MNLLNIYYALLPVCLIAALFLWHIHKSQQALIAFMESTLDSMNKLAQVGFIHAKAKSPEQAVTQQVILETAQKDLETQLEEELKEEPSKPKGPPRGFVGSDGKTYHFATAPSAQVLSKIPPSQLVY